MSQQRPPPPEPEQCLTRTRVSRYKGGTLIAEDVLDLATHQRRLADPDGYRPAECPRCGCRVLHVHDYPERTPIGDADIVVIRLVRYICADEDCEATWRTLPAFVARHLWRTWSTVERSVLGDVPKKRDAPPIPKRTEQRWRARLAATARQLVVLLATSGGVVLGNIARQVGLDGTRCALVSAYADAMKAPMELRLVGVAVIAHRLERGIRLM